MSGPIVRKYGFPNFEQIFGKRELEHGVDEPETEAPAEEPKAADAPAQPATKAGPKSKEK
jgi:hypothetical protein